MPRRSGKSAPRGVRKPQQARSRRTRERILEAAVECFEASGYDQTTTAAIAARAGTAVAVDDERQFQALAVVTALMAMFFEQVASAANWLEGEGVPAPEAASYASSMFQALANLTTLEDPEGLAAMAEECLTAGGVNEQVLHELRDAGWFDTYRARLDRIMDRFDKA